MERNHSEIVQLGGINMLVFLATWIKQLLSGDPVESTELDTGKKCNCRRTQCLKLYCKCFAQGEYCRGCNCMNCCNTVEAEGKRQKAIQQVLKDQPRAFCIGEEYRICKCRNSRCLKNYCECHKRGKVCSSLCKCRECMNRSLM